MNDHPSRVAADLELAVGAALRERIVHEHPDLDHLVAASLRRGHRMRTRRRVGVVAGVGAAVAFAGAAGAVVGQGGIGRDSGAAPVDGAAVADASPTTAAPDDVRASLTPLDPGSASSAPSSAGTSGGVGTPTPALPVALDLAGWTCDGAAVDEKLSCTSTGGGSLSIVVRPRADYAEWLTSSDKGAAPGVVVGPAQRDFFVTVQGDLGDTPAQAFLDALRYADHWERPAG